MDGICEKIKYSLDESRTLILGCQVLTGFQFNIFFQKLYPSLPASSQWLTVGTLSLMLIALAVLMTPAFYHQIVENGNDTVSLNTLATTTIEIALVPFGTALGFDFFVVTRTISSTEIAFCAGIASAVVTSFFWFGIEHFRRGGERKEDMKEKETPIKDKVDHVLTEARIVIPGGQAILGFQFIVFLTEAFQNLPRGSKLIHLGSLGLVALSVVLLMTPAAYHREVEKGEATEGFHKIASRFVLAASVPLALGLSSDFFVVANMVLHSPARAALISSAILLFILGIWFGYPFAVRNFSKRMKARK